MDFKKMAGLALTAAAFNLTLLTSAQAISVEVKCEVRSNRSKISVDGKGYVGGLYRAGVFSGTGVAWAKAFKRPIAGQLEFDFDSNPADVAAGATFIPATFIKNRTVNGRIYSYNPTTRVYRLLGSVSNTCSIKR